MRLMQGLCKIRMLSDIECSWLVFLQVQESYLRVNWLNNVNKKQRWFIKLSDREHSWSTLWWDSRDLWMLGSWFTYIKNTQLKDEVINLFNESKLANLTISILREMMQVL